MRVAITRAMPDAERTATLVRAHGAEALLAPLLTIAPRAFDADISGAQALLFTSAAGVRAFAEASGARGVRVLAVGEATASAARSAGFSNVEASDGDSARLAVLAGAHLDPANGALIHICGVHVADDLVGALRAAGFAAERRIVYKAMSVSALPPAFSTDLDIVLFHSARAATVFLGFGAPKAANLTAACLSPNVAETASRAPWRRIIAAPAPTDAALIAAALS